MNSPQKLRIKSTMLLLLALSLGINSCKKSKSNETGDKSGPAKVTVRMFGVEEGSQPLASNGTGSGKLAVNSTGFQTRVVPFTKDISIVATLVPAGSMAVAGTGNDNPLSINATKPALKTAGVVQSPLADGVIYKVLVYDDADNYVTGNTFFYGQTVTPFILDAGKTYTFVAFSVNSAATIPFIGSGDPLASAALSGVVGDFMYFKTTRMLNYGDNNLDIVLKHLFSQITTRFILTDALESQKITGLGGVSISPATSGADISLADGSLTYRSALSDGAPVAFGTIPADGVLSPLASPFTSSPTLVINPATSTGTFNISSLTIGGTQKTNIVFPDLNITPGQKYNLNLTFKSPCTIDVGTNPDIDINLQDTGTPPPPPTVTLNAPSADFGFVFNITQLDNSFNMTVNGTPLISKAGSTDHEIQFQSLSFSTPVVENIQFADGEQWGAGSIAQIYFMSGTTATPIVRVVISPTGDVSMYGSKTNNGTLFPLALIGGYTFNHVPWYTGATNTVIVSQQVIGTTVMQANGQGKKIVACTN